MKAYLGNIRGTLSWKTIAKLVWKLIFCVGKLSRKDRLGNDKRAHWATLFDFLRGEALLVNYLETIWGNITHP